LFVKELESDRPKRRDRKGVVRGAIINLAGHSPYFLLFYILVLKVFKNSRTNIEWFLGKKR